MTSPDSMFPGLNLADVLKCTLVAVIHEGGGVLEQCTVLYCTVLYCTGGVLEHLAGIKFISRSHEY